MKGKSPLTICVTGGKGGTGKTFCAVNLAVMLQNAGNRVLFLDGDSENPNAFLLFDADLANGELVHMFKPRILEDECTKCGLCAQYCLYHALLHIEGSVPILMQNLCSGCKLCYKLCPVDAIEPDSKDMGYIYQSQYNGMKILTGELKPSEAKSAVIIEDLLEIAEKYTEMEDYDFIVIDTAPGAHCDVELLISEADMVVPVTEPTRFGKLDLARIIELIDLLGKDYKVIVNRSTLPGYKDKFNKYIVKNGIDVLGEIPLDDVVVTSYCQSKPLMGKENGFEGSEAYEAFQEVYSNLMDWINQIKEIEGIK